MSLKSLSAGLVLGFVLAGAGCSVLAPRGPTEVARGEYYSAGQPEFDQFFIELHRLQVELLRAPDEPQKARSALAISLGLPADASDDSLGSRLSQEAKKLSARGVRLRLEIPELAPGVLDASATLHSSDLGVQTPLRPALSTEATRIVRSRNQLAGAAEQLEKLRVTGINLEGRIGEVFRKDGPWKRDEVRRNLADGQKLITVMLARGKEVEAFDVKLLTLLSAQATTDSELNRALPIVAAPAPPAASEDRAAADAAVTKKPLASAKPRSLAGGARPKASEADTEGAAPKPTQGSAPAEIEP